MLNVINSVPRGDAVEMIGIQLDFLFSHGNSFNKIEMVYHCVYELEFS